MWRAIELTTAQRSLEVRDLCRARQDPAPDPKLVMTYVASASDTAAIIAVD